MLGFNINTSKIDFLSLFSLNEVYYLEASPEMWLSVVCMSSEYLKARFGLHCADGWKTTLTYAPR